jgi:hypothetical protein
VGGGDAGHLDHDPWRVVAQHGVQPHALAREPLLDRMADRRHLAQDLERYREVVRRVDPDGVDVGVAVAERYASRPQQARRPELAAADDLGQLGDTRVVAPLVHDEQPSRVSGGERGRLLGIGCERLFDEDGNVLRGQQRLDDVAVGCRGGRYDSAVQRRELADAGHRLRPAGAGPVAALRRASDRPHLAAQRHEVPEYVPTPSSDAD